MNKDRSGLVKLGGIITTFGVAGATAVALLDSSAAAYTPPPIVPLVVPAVQGPELLRNPGMEGPFTSREFNEITIADKWSAWYCDIPYTAAKCEVPLQDNPYERYMQKPEFTPNNPLQTECLTSSFLNRVHSGCNGQHFFGFSRVIRAGVQQTIVNLTPGNYQLSMWAQIWSNGQQNAQGCVRRNSSNACVEWMSVLYTSDIASLDDVTAMSAILGYDPTCGTNAFASTVIWSRNFGYTEGLYDNYARVFAPVRVTGNCVTVFLGGFSRFANYHNDFYFDDASLRLAASGQPIPTNTASPAPTRTPTAVPGATATRTPTPIASCPTPVACQPPVEVTRIVEVTRVVVATQGAGPTPTQLPPGTQPPANATPLGGDPITYRVIAGGGLNMRNGPFSTATILVTLPYGSVVEYEDEKLYGWIRVRYGGLVGWMYGLYLQEVIVPKP